MRGEIGEKKKTRGAGLPAQPQAEPFGKSCGWGIGLGGAYCKTFSETNLAVGWRTGVRSLAGSEITNLPARLFGTLKQAPCLSMGLIVRLSLRQVRHSAGKRRGSVLHRCGGMAMPSEKMVSGGSSTGGGSRDKKAKPEDVAEAVAWLATKFAGPN